MRGLITTLAIGALVGCDGGDPAAAGAAPAGDSPGSVLYFFDSDCPDCKEVESLHLEAIAAAADCPVELVERINVVEPAGAKRLLGIEAARACRTLAPILVVNRKVLCGIEEIRGAHGSPSPGERPPRA